MGTNLHAGAKAVLPNGRGAVVSGGSPSGPNYALEKAAATDLTNMAIWAVFCLRSSFTLSQWCCRASTAAHCLPNSVCGLFLQKQQPASFTQAHSLPRPGGFCTSGGQACKPCRNHTVAAHNIFSQKQHKDRLQERWL